jgi:hypothetical protein
MNRNSIIGNLYYTIRGTLHQWKWGLIHRFHPSHRYNILKTGLPPSYYDPDYQILYAVMNCFRQFMESESGAKAFSWGSEEDYGYLTEAERKENAESIGTTKAQKADLDKIYDWWVNRYLFIQEKHQNYWTNKRDLPREEQLTRAEEHTMFDIQEQLEQEADEMLALLMKHRRTLWYA